MKVGILFGAAIWAFGAAVAFDGAQSGIALGAALVLFAMGLAEIE